MVAVILSQIYHAKISITTKVQETGIRNQNHVGAHQEN